MLLARAWLGCRQGLQQAIEGCSSPMWPKPEPAMAACAQVRLVQSWCTKATCSCVTVWCVT